MFGRKPKEPAVVPEAPPVPAPPPAPPPADTHLVLLWGEGDTLTPYQAPGLTNEKEFFFNNKPYSHVDVTDGGVWIYRNDRKN